MVKSWYQSCYMLTYQFLAVRHDYIINSADDLMLVIEPPADEADNDTVKFIFDGEDAMLIRNSGQIIYLPCLHKDVIKIISSRKDIIVAELQGYDLQTISALIKQKIMPDFSDYYTADIVITASPLEIPHEKLYELRVIYGIKSEIRRRSF